MLISKDPWAKRTFIFDWSADTDGNLIVGSTFTAEPGLVLSHELLFGDAQRTAVRVEEGEPGRRYALRNEVVFADGDRDAFEVTVAVAPRR